MVPFVDFVEMTMLKLGSPKLEIGLFFVFLFFWERRSVLPTIINLSFSTFFYSRSLKNANKRLLSNSWARQKKTCSTFVHFYSNVEQGKEIHKFISTAGIIVEISVKKNNLNREKLYQ